MVNFPQIALRGLQLLFTVIALSLVANAVDIQHFHNSGVNFAVFAAVWAFLALLIGLAAAFVEKANKVIVLAVMDGGAVLFTFIAGVVLAAQLGVHSCSNSGYLASNKLAQGSSHRCRELQAACAFFWFAFAAFCGSFIMDFFGASSGGGMSRRGGRHAGPTMSQV